MTVAGRTCEGMGRESQQPWYPGRFLSSLSSSYHLCKMGRKTNRQTDHFVALMNGIERWVSLRQWPLRALPHSQGHFFRCHDYLGCVEMDMRPPVECAGANTKFHVFLGWCLTPLLILRFLTWTSSNISATRKFCCEKWCGGANILLAWEEQKEEAYITRNTLILLINIYSFLFYECLPARVSVHQVCTVELELDSWNTLLRAESSEGRPRSWLGATSNPHTLILIVTLEEI